MSPSAAKLREWRECPKKFAWDQFKLNLDVWQEEGLDYLASPSYVPRRRIAFKACTGPGKTLELAIIGWWRLTCFAERGEHPKGAALSGEGRDNLRDNLWAELAKLRERSEFIKTAFKQNDDRIVQVDNPKTWFLAARSYAKDADAEAIGRALSGLHSLFPFLLLDEVGDAPPTLGQKAEQIFTGGPKDALIALSGNPTSTGGLLYHVCVTLAGQYYVITITADPDDPRRTPRVDPVHARDMIERYGRDNPWVMATILGQFPPSGFNTLLAPEEVERAMRRHLREDQYSFAQKRLGIDAARFGTDPWVIAPRQGLAAFRMVEMRNPRSFEVSARVIKAKLDWGSEIESFDGTGGYAAGAVDSMIQAGYSPYEVNFSGKADDPRYFNKRSEMWFRMAEWVKRGGALPNDPGLIRELTTPMFYYQNSKFRLEEKEQIMKRLKFSPNKGDALALTFALPDMPEQTSPEAIFRRAVESTRQQADWDPFAGKDWDPFAS